MRRLLLALFLLFTTPVFAADNYTATQGTGTTFRAQDVGTGILSPYVVLGTITGTSIGGTAGTSNAYVLSVQGIASGTALPISAASGTFASGSLAAGSLVDLLTMRGTKAAGTAAANSLLAGCVYTSAGITLTDGQQAACQFTSTGGILVSVANANANGQATMANSSPVVIASNQSAISVNPLPTTAGGLSVYFVQPAASDNHVVIKAGAGQVYKVTATNNSATVNYLRLYNATTGFNGCNSATNLVYQVAIPASTSVGGISDSWDLGIAFATGISICVTSGYATTDTTNATASAMSVNVGYK